MQENSSISNINDIPAFSQKKGYAFDTLDLDLYRELNLISEEIGRCRSEHLK